MSLKVAEAYFDGNRPRLETSLSDLFDCLIRESKERRRQDLSVCSILVESDLSAARFGNPVCYERTLIDASGCLVEIVTVGGTEFTHQRLTMSRGNIADAANAYAC